MTGGSLGDGSAGPLHRDHHSQAETSLLDDTAAAALSPLSPDSDGGDVKLEDITGLSLARLKSQESKILDHGRYFSWWVGRGSA